MCSRTGDRHNPVFGAFSQGKQFGVMDLRANLLKIFFPIVFSAITGQLFLHSGSAVAETRAGFHIQEQWNLGGKEGWGPLLFDSPSHLLYVPRTDRVMVLDTESGKVTGEITGFIDAREMVLDDAGKYGFVTDITDGTVGFVRVFDRSTLKLVSTVHVGRIPGVIVFDPATKNVFAFSSRDRNASVIDTTTNLVVETIPLPGKPHIAVTDGKGTIFVGLRGIGQMARIDTASRRLTGTWSMAPCAEFKGLTFDAVNRQLLGSCADGKLIAVNANSGQAITLGESAIGDGDLVFDSQSGLLISAANNGVLTIFHQESASQYTRQEEVSTLPRAGTLALDPGKSRVYLITAKFQQRQVVGPGMEEAESRLTPVPDSIVVLVVGP